MAGVGVHFAVGVAINVVAVDCVVVAVVCGAVVVVGVEGEINN